MDNFADADLSDMALDDLLSLAESDDKATSAVEHATAQVASAEPAQASEKHIAIIGMAGKIASCADLDAFWQLLHDGKTTRRSLPFGRLVDLNEYLRLKGAQNSHKQVQYFDESFLSDIDKFDHRFFGMAKQEANLSDPNQRLFLETAWTCLEHAGYGGQAVKGTQTGIFVGFSADFGDAYRDIVRTLAPDAPEVAVVGNVKSLIAARLAYHLDLHGPTMMIDTACSSGLVAVHQACRALQAGDCEMALAGAVKIDLVPVADDPETRIGIKDIQATMATDGRTKTFDHESEGTSGAEGVVAFLLKPLEQALADGDTVHAVIIGTAINQDGQSVGITAPNMAAQEELIVRALNDAKIHPETVSYIEAHGTATRLGDPVEVAGIDRAYRRYTQRRQYCAIGSVKTNIGHMDNGAGLAGLAKVVLALKHKQIPASLNFQSPNRKIAFSQSPVYVNDRLQDWRSEAGVPLRAGINSFGLSGTNCHLLVQEPPSQDQTARKLVAGPFLLPISATSEHALERLLQAWYKHLKTYHGPVQDLCFTACVGRGHYPHRVAICFEDFAQLQQIMNALAHGARDLPQAAFGFVRVADDKRTHANEAGQISEAEKKAIDRKAQDLCSQFARLAGNAAAPNKLALLQEAQQAYVQGADFPWQVWYQGMACQRIVLPTYPFAATRCWVEMSEMGSKSNGHAPAKQFRHPLLDRCAAQSHQFRLYETMLGVESHWELGEHKVKGMYILPGTAFIEMMLEVAAHLQQGPQHMEAGLLVVQALQIEQIAFLRPFALASDLRKVVQVLVREQGQGADLAHEIQIVSRAGDSAAQQDNQAWEVHAQAVLRPAKASQPAAQDLSAIKARLTENMPYTSKEDASRGLEIGARWNMSVQQAWTRPEHDEVLVHLSLPDIYHNDHNLYHYHPALLDTAVNAANHLLGDGGLYLPFFYKTLDIFSRLPAQFYAHLRRKPGASIEASQFSIQLLTLTGQVCAQVDEYTVKLVHEHELGGISYESHLHVVSLVADLEQGPREPANPPVNAQILLIHDGSPDALQLRANLQKTAQVFEIIRPPAQALTEEFDYSAELRNLLGAESKSAPALNSVIYALGWASASDIGQSGDHSSDHSNSNSNSNNNSNSNSGAPAESAAKSVSALELATSGSMASILAHDLFDFVRHFLQLKLRCSGNLLLLARGAFAVPNHSITVAPQAAALAALARVIRLENPQLRWRCVDTDVLPDTHLLWQEISATDAQDLSVYREQVRYHEKLSSLASTVLPTTAHYVPHTDGIYLITGGLGALGLELAQMLTQQGALNLALIVSSNLPQRDEWEDLLSDPHAPRKLRHSVKRVLELEKNGSRVEIISADVADFARMQEVLKDLRADYGRINGVVHAAGRAGDGYLHRKERSVFGKVVQPKMDGAWHLHQLTLGDPLEFFVMYSSVATVLRSAGQSDYTAANAYLDSLAHFRRSLGLCGVALCWPAWREVGIAFEYGAVDEEEFFAPINTLDAMQLMSRILADEGDLPAVVVVSEINQRAKLEVIDALHLELDTTMRKRLQQAAARRQHTSGGQGQGQVAVLVHGAAVDTVLGTLAQVWSRILGVQEMSVDDTFSEFGGNSILTTQLYTELEKIWPGVVDVVDLFTYTSLREQSDFVRNALGVELAETESASDATQVADVANSAANSAEDEDAEMDRILALLAQGDMSAEEAQSLL